MAPGHLHPIRYTVPMIAMITWFGEKIVAAEISHGELEVILDDYTLERPPFYLYFLKEYQSLKILQV